jgi:2-methylisocitrate lyase-like PEP mutase family enzyme
MGEGPGPRRHCVARADIETLRGMLARDRGVILPSAPNALAARVIADLGFKAIYLTGAGLTTWTSDFPTSDSWI